MTIVLGGAAYRLSVPVKPPGGRKALAPLSSQVQLLCNSLGPGRWLMNADGAQGPPHVEPHPHALYLSGQTGERPAAAPVPRSLTEPCLPSLLQAPHPSFHWLPHQEKYQVRAGSQGQPGHHLMKISTPPLAFYTRANLICCAQEMPHMLRRPLNSLFSTGFFGGSPSKLCAIIKSFVDNGFF